jgi:hypothetical protein
MAFTIGSRLNKLSGLIKNSVASLADIRAMADLAPLEGNYLPWTRASMRPAGIRFCTNVVRLTNPDLIVELGGGNSTFYLRRLLREKGQGFLLTFEENLEWAEHLTQLLVREELGEYGRVVHAPLAPTANDEFSGQWYDPKIVTKTLDEQDQKIGVLVIDGPSGHRVEEAPQYSRRVFALPFLSQYLANTNTVMIDDTNREGEKNCVRLWQKQLNRPFSRVGLAGGYSYTSNSPLQLD